MPRSAANRYEYTPAAKGARRLRTIALGYLMAAGAADAAALAKRQYDEADNMTDRQGALGVLVNGDAPEREAALAAFYERYRDNALVLDKWFTAQALSTRDDTAGGGRGAGRAIPISRSPTRTGCARWSAPSRSTSAPSTTHRAAATASSPT